MADRRCIYLHEVISIVGAGSEPYKAHTGGDWAKRWSDGRALLVGTWQQSGSTGDWPRVVNLWEMAGWDHWAEILEQQYRGAGQPRGLKTWWNKALEYRSGGFDRILEPATFSPSCRDLVTAGVKGRACVQEIATVQSGQVDAYLDAVRRRWQPLAAKRGFSLLGAYRTTMRDTEAVLVWSLPTVRHFTDYLKDVGVARDLVRWADTAREWRTDYRETLLIPSQWCVTHPDWRPPKGIAARATRRP
jgi:hypothetical protein